MAIFFFCVYEGLCWAVYVLSFFARLCSAFWLQGFLDIHAVCLFGVFNCYYSCLLLPPNSYLDLKMLRRTVTNFSISHVLCSNTPTIMWDATAKEHSFMYYSDTDHQVECYLYGLPFCFPQQHFLRQSIDSQVGLILHPHFFFTLTLFSLLPQVFYPTLQSIKVRLDLAESLGTGISIWCVCNLCRKDTENRWKSELLTQSTATVHWFCFYTTLTNPSPFPCCRDIGQGLDYFWDLF